MDSTEPITDLYELLSPTQKTMIAGGMGGSCAKTATAPLSRLTILYQVGSLLPQSRGSGASSEFKGSLTQSFQRVIREEGIKAFWKGNLTSVIHRFPYSAINFSTYEMIRKIFCSTPDRETPLVRFISGAVAGAAACTACYPLDLIRTRLTVNLCSDQTPCMKNQPVGIWQHINHIIKNEGPAGLYRGLLVSLAVSVPNLAIGFSAYGTLKEHMMTIESDMFRDQKHNLNSYGCFISGAISGIISSLVIFPADVVRRRMQVLGMSIAAKEAQLRQSLANNIKNHSIGAENIASNASTASISTSNIDRSQIESIATSAKTSESTTTVNSNHNSNQQRIGVNNSHINHNNIPKASAITEIKNILHNEGIRGFYRGIVPELLKVTPMVGVTFFVYEMTLKLLKHEAHN